MKKPFMLLACLVLAQYGYTAEYNESPTSSRWNQNTAAVTTPAPIESNLGNTGSSGRAFGDRNFGADRRYYKVSGAAGDSSTYNYDMSNPADVSGSYDMTNTYSDMSSNQGSCCTAPACCDPCQPKDCTIYDGCEEGQCPPTICYEPCCKYEPCYSCVRKCEMCPQYRYKKCCQYVPQYYQKCECCYVPQYSYKTCCRYVPQYYCQCECVQCPRYYNERHCKYVPRYYYKCVSRPTCNPCVENAPACCPQQ